MTAVEDRLAQIEARDLLPCGACDGGLPMACSCGDPRASLSLTTAALRAVLAVHHDGRFADEVAYDNPPYCLESETDEYPCTTLVAIATAFGVIL